MDYQYHKIKSQIAVLRDVLSEYGANHSIDNIITQLEARAKFMEEHKDD